MMHLLRYGHLKDNEFLGSWSYDEHEAWSSYCVRCQPELAGTETMEDFFIDRRKRYPIDETTLNKTGDRDNG